MMGRVMLKLRRILIAFIITTIIGVCVFLCFDSKSLRRLLGDAYMLYFIRNFNVSKSWLKEPKSFCNGQFVGYGNELARLKEVVFIAKDNVGKFEMLCDEEFSYTFNSYKEDNHLNMWVKQLQYKGDGTYTHIEEKQKTTLAVHRYEYANLYHQMTDYYNAFAVMKLFNLKPDRMDILLVDKRPDSPLEKIWYVLFGNVTLVQEVKHPLIYHDLIWAVLGYNSPVNFHSINHLSFVKDFSVFVKSRYGVSTTKDLKCDAISILFIWRKNYVAHPGNPSGHISRKIKNEEELLNDVQKTFPGHTVAGIQLDVYSMKDQLNYISQTDILIAMHGAGLSHVLFLPEHAGVLELYPTYWPKTNRHFRAMAHWKQLHYLNWQNTNPSNEYSDLFTYIPSLVVTQRVQSLYYEMCGNFPSQSHDNA